MRDLDDLLKLANSIGEETKQDSQNHISNIDQDVEKLKNHQSLIEEPPKKQVDNPYEVDQFLANLGIHQQTIPKEAKSSYEQSNPFYEKPKDFSHLDPFQQSMHQTQQVQQKSEKPIDYTKLASSIPAKKPLPKGVQKIQTIEEMPKQTLEDFEKNGQLELEKLSKITYQIAQAQPKQIDEILSKKEITVEDSQSLAAIISQVNAKIDEQPKKVSQAIDPIINDEDEFLDEFNDDFDEVEEKPIKKKRSKKEKKPKKDKKDKKDKKQSLIVQRIFQWFVIIALAIIIGFIAAQFIIKYFLATSMILLPIAQQILRL